MLPGKCALLSTKRRLSETFQLTICETSLTSFEFAFPFSSPVNQTSRRTQKKGRDSQFANCNQWTIWVAGMIDAERWRWVFCTFKIGLQFASNWKLFSCWKALICSNLPCDAVVCVCVLSSRACQSQRSTQFDQVYWQIQFHSNCSTAIESTALNLI